MTRVVCEWLVAKLCRREARCRAASFGTCSLTTLLGCQKSGEPALGKWNVGACNVSAMACAIGDSSASFFPQLIFAVAPTRKIITRFDFHGNLLVTILNNNPIHPPVQRILYMILLLGKKYRLLIPYM